MNRGRTERTEGERNCNGEHTGLAYLRLLGAQLAIGAAAIFARFALMGAGPFAAGALRLGIAALVVLAIAGPLRRLGARREGAFVAAGMALGLHFATWIASLLYTSVAVSTLLVTTAPIWTELYDALRERRMPSAWFATSLVLAIAGVAIIASARSSPAPIPGHAFAGAVLALAGGMAIAAYLLVVRDAGARHGDPLGTRQIVARTYSYAAVALFVAAFVARQPAPRLGDGVAWGGILAMALISQLLGHTALNAALRDFSPSVVALTTLLEPAIAAAFAALLFGEALTLPVFAGGALVLAAVAVTLRAPRPLATLP